MENILILHGAVVASCLTYFFKFSEKDNTFFEDNYSRLADIKSRITGEIAEEISKLGTPVPGVIIATNGSQHVDYVEGNSNPLKGEKFKNWLDGYLSREFTFLDHYSEFKKIYYRWSVVWKTMKIYSIGLAVLEVLNLSLCYYWLNKCLKVNEKGQPVDVVDYKFCTGDTNDTILISGGIAVFLVILGLLLLFYADNLQNRLVNYKDSYNAL